MRALASGCLAAVALLWYSGVSLGKQIESSGQNNTGAVQLAPNRLELTTANKEVASTKLPSWAQIETNSSSRDQKANDAGGKMTPTRTKAKVIERRAAQSAIAASSRDQETLLPRFTAPIGNVTAVLGRDVRLVCQVENLGSYQVSSGAEPAGYRRAS